MGIAFEFNKVQNLPDSNNLKNIESILPFYHLFLEIILCQVLF